MRERWAFGLMSSDERPARADRWIQAQRALRRLALLVAAALLAGCGSGASNKTSTTTVPGAAAAMRELIAVDPSLAGRVEVLFESPTWAVVESRRARTASAVAFHLVQGVWVPDRSGSVSLTIVGPKAGSTTSDSPQVAIELKAHAPLVETALWVDGRELIERGGGTPREGTVFGSPAAPLKAGEHVAVGYGRTKANGTATAWVFTTVPASTRPRAGRRRRRGVRSA